MTWGTFRVRLRITMVSLYRVHEGFLLCSGWEGCYTGVVGVVRVIRVVY